MDKKFKIFTSQLAPTGFFGAMVGYKYQILYIMSGIQKPSLHVKMKISKSFVAPVISKITFHYEPPCSSHPKWSGGGGVNSTPFIPVNTYDMHASHYN